tara:strand:+ start:69 stop:179 length:111 start_codon:yes stop_codon:yes gene_type:complete
MPSLMIVRHPADVVDAMAVAVMEVAATVTAKPLQRG